MRQHYESPQLYLVPVDQRCKNTIGMWSKTLQTVPKCPPNTLSTKKRFQMPLKSLKGSLFLASTHPMEEATDTAKSIPKSIKGKSKALLCGIFGRHQFYIRFRLADTRFRRSIRIPFQPAFTCLRPFQFIFVFERMSLAFCMFLIIAIIVFLDHEQLISISFPHTCPACVRKTTRHPKMHSKCFLKPPAKASLSTWKMYQKS